MDAQALLQAITGSNPAALERPNTNVPAVRVPVGGLHAFLQLLRDDPRFSFDFLMDHTAIDWMADNQFEMVYQLYSTLHGHSMMVGVLVDRECPLVPTVSDLWPIAEWQEREVYDLFGIPYDNHPDLRRLFLEDDWTGYPLRKDYQDPNMLQRPQ